MLWPAACQLPAWETRWSQLGKADTAADSSLTPSCLFHRAEKSGCKEQRSWNHGTVWVRRDLRDHLITRSLPGTPSSRSRLLKASSCLASNTYRDGAGFSEVPPGVPAHPRSWHPLGMARQTAGSMRRCLASAKHQAHSTGFPHGAPHTLTYPIFRWHCSSFLGAHTLPERGKVKAATC